MSFIGHLLLNKLVYFYSKGFVVVTSGINPLLRISTMKLWCAISSEPAY
jgi:hypothetical protein